MKERIVKFRLHAGGDPIHLWEEVMMVCPTAPPQLRRVQATYGGLGSVRLKMFETFLLRMQASQGCLPARAKAARLPPRRDQ